MSFIDRTTGHDRGDERNVAILLYVAIIAMIVGALIFVFIIGLNPKLNPLKAGPSGEAPPVRAIDAR